MSVSKTWCGPCLHETIEKEGVVYCRDCEEPLCDKCKLDHKKIKVSKHHKLCDLADVPPQEIQDCVKRLIACPNHEKEEVVYLCKDHDVTCCNKCAMADHRKCEEVKVLSDILNDMKLDCSGLKTALRELQQTGESLLEHEQKHAEMIAETEREAMSLLQDIKRKLHGLIYEIEIKVVWSIAAEKKDIFGKIGPQRESVSQILNDIEHQASYIEQIEKFGRDDYIVLMKRTIEKETLPILQSSVEVLNKSRTQSSFKCTVNTRLDSLLEAIKDCLQIDDIVCDVLETGSNSKIQQTSTFTERIPQLQSEKDLCEMQLIDKKDNKKTGYLHMDRSLHCSIV